MTLLNSDIPQKNQWQKINSRQYKSICLNYMITRNTGGMFDIKHLRGWFPLMSSFENLNQAKMAAKIHNNKGKITTLDLIDIKKLV